jgi:hypothetical protein
MAQAKRSTVPARSPDPFDPEHSWQFPHDQGNVDSSNKMLTVDKKHATYHPTSRKERKQCSPRLLGPGSLGARGAIGTALGATLGVMTAIGIILAIPNLSMIIAGPIFTMIAGVGAGALTGGIIGGLLE